QWSRLRFSAYTLKKTENSTGVSVKASEPTRSLERIREPSLFPWRSMYSFTKARTSMKPSVTVRIKIKVETPQMTTVSRKSVGPYVPKSKDPCQMTSANNSRKQRPAMAVATARRISTPILTEQEQGAERRFQNPTVWVLTL